MRQHVTFESDIGNAQDPLFGKVGAKNSTISGTSWPIATSWPAPFGPARARSCRFVEFEPTARTDKLGREISTTVPGWA